MELKLPVADASPYPPIQVRETSQLCARAMLSQLGGSASEMSTIVQYFYNSTVLAAKYPKIAEYFHRIAVVEMHHLSVFAQLTCLSGGDPRLWSYREGRTVYWSPSALFYSNDPAALLNRAVMGENRTITEYRRLSGELPDPCVKALLERLILDEEQHVLIFRQLLKEMGKGGRK